MGTYNLTEDLAVLGITGGLLAEPVAHWRKERGRKVHAPNRWGESKTACGVRLDGLVEVPVSYLDPEPDMCATCEARTTKRGSWEMASWVHPLAEWARALERAVARLEEGTVTAEDVVAVGEARGSAERWCPAQWQRRSSDPDSWAALDAAAEELGIRTDRVAMRLREACAATRDGDLERELVADVLLTEARSGSLTESVEGDPLVIGDWWRCRAVISHWVEATQSGSTDIEAGRQAVVDGLMEVLTLNLDVLIYPRLRAKGFANPAEWARAEWALLVADTGVAFASRWEARAAELWALTEAPEVVVVADVDHLVDRSGLVGRIEARAQRRWGPVSGRLALSVSPLAALWLAGALGVYSAGGHLLTLGETERLDHIVEPFLALWDPRTAAVADPDEVLRTARALTV